MNWYSIIKIAQIWNLSEEDDWSVNQFESNLRDLYKLEYMWSMINQRSFNGLEQRRQNISDNLRNNLNSVAEEVKASLSMVFHNWLRTHAILDPETWARSRVDEMTDFHNFSEIFSSMLGEYMQYSAGGELPPFFSPQQYSAMQNKSMREMLRFIMDNIDEMPSFKLSLEEGLDGHKDMLRNELSDYGLEEFSEMRNEEFKSEEEAEAYIENISVDDVDLDSLYYFDSAEEFAIFVDQSVNSMEMLVEFYEKLVFPLWYRHWEAQGIDSTRENIEQINARLEGASAENTQEFMAAVNLALNAAHQTGAMTDYIENDMAAHNIKNILEDLSSGTEVPVWNEQLKQVGVQV
jgi:hypothetical protein